MRGYVVDVFDAAVGHVPGPAVVAPGDELECGIASAHGFGEIDRGGNRLIFAEAALAIVCFVAELPEFDGVRRGMTMSLALGVIGIVAVGHPISGFARVAGAVAFGFVSKMLEAVAEEIDAVKRFSANAAGEIDEFMRAHA